MRGRCAAGHRRDALPAGLRQWQGTCCESVNPLHPPDLQRECARKGADGGWGSTRRRPPAVPPHRRYRHTPSRARALFHPQITACFGKHGRMHGLSLGPYKEEAKTPAERDWSPSSQLACSRNARACRRDAVAQQPWTSALLRNHRLPTQVWRGVVLEGQCRHTAGVCERCSKHHCKSRVPFPTARRGAAAAVQTRRRCRCTNASCA